MTLNKFNYSVLDRIADYEMVNINKLRKKAYLIKSVHDLVLPKIKQRIELKEKFGDVN